MNVFQERTALETIRKCIGKSAEGHVLVESPNMEVTQGVKAYFDSHRPRPLLVLQPYWRMPTKTLFGPTTGAIIHSQYYGKRRGHIPTSDTPIVNIGKHDDSTPYVVADYFSDGALAVEHFRELQLPHATFMGVQGQTTNSGLMQEGFEAAIAKIGLEYHPCPEEGFLVVGGRDPDLCRIAHWLRELPKPIGLLTPFGQIARSLVVLCTKIGLRIPQDIALLCGANESITCRFVTPSISTIMNNHWQIGYEAGRMLDRLMAGKSLESSVVRIPAVRVDAQPSTEHLAVSNRRLVRAVQEIRESACGEITIPDIARRAGLSRRNLELLFRQHFNMTVHEEISRVRLRRAKELLGSSNHSIGEIAMECGLKWPGSLNKLFQKELGLSPGEYRKQFRKAMRSGQATSATFPKISSS